MFPPFRINEKCMLTILKVSGKASMSCQKGLNSLSSLKVAME
jgi:hypothetical protein